MVIALLPWALAGCHGGGPSCDNRLAAADSLLRHNNPDSALRLLEAIDGSRLTDSYRAYHALLLTQAQYRCYADITSDSTINVALEYYQRHHGAREKLTRAYIYKAAVTEVLGNPEGAMTYYKQAVSTASPDDHYNLGYAKLRIGNLYRDYLVADSSDITSVKLALRHFEQIPDSFYIMTCLSSIGGSYAANSKNDQAIRYLEKADSLAKALGLKSEELNNLIYLSDLKMFSEDKHVIEEAKRIALSILEHDYCPPDRRDHLLLTAAYTLAKLNQTDSANLYLSSVDKDNLTENLEVFYHLCCAEIARCHRDINQFEYHFREADHLADSLLTNTMQQRLREVEAKYDNEALRYEALRQKANWQLLLMGSLLAVSLLAIAWMVTARQSSRRKRQIIVNQDTIKRLQSDSTQLTTQLTANHAMNEDLKATIGHQIETFTQLVEMHYTQFNQHPKKFSALFQKAYDVNQPDVSFWTGLRAYVDSSCDDIITRTLESYPSINENDMRFMSLYCCELPATVVMVCMGYNDVHSVYNKKKRIAAKLKLDGNETFDDYIQRFRHQGRGRCPV